MSDRTFGNYISSLWPVFYLPAHTAFFLFGSKSGQVNTCTIQLPPQTYSDYTSMCAPHYAHQRDQASHTNLVSRSEVATSILSIVHGHLFISHCRVISSSWLLPLSQENQSKVLGGLLSFVFQFNHSDIFKVTVFKYYE